MAVIAAAEPDYASPAAALQCVGPEPSSCRGKFAIRPPISLGKRPLTSGSSRAPQPAVPCGKKTRDLPNLCVCHGCGLRYPDKGRKGSLRALESQWRVVLLCASCHGDVRSGAMCSYCLSRFSEVEERGSMDCLECRCRVHLACLPKQRGFVIPCDLDSRRFACVDCCAVPEFLRPRVSCSDAAREVGVSLEDVVKNANYTVAKKEEEAYRAKEKALEKALVARHATELAISALDFVALVSEGADLACKTDLADDQLALLLHKSMNGSHRISRNHCSSNLGHLVHSKESICSDLSSSRESLTGSKKLCLEVQFCMENKSFEMDDVEAIESLVRNVEGEKETSLELNSFVNGSLEDSEKSKNNLEEDAGKEEQASCSEKVVTSAIGDNSVDSISVPLERSSSSYDGIGLSNDATQVDGSEDTFVAHLQTACNIRDRYLNKYFRNFRTKRYGKKYSRNFRLGNRVDEKQSEGSASAFLSCQSKNLSKTSSSIFNARESLTVILDASANATRLSRCQSWQRDQNQDV